MGNACGRVGRSRTLTDGKHLFYSFVLTRRVLAMNRTRAGVLVLLAAGGGVAYYLGHARPAALVLTGIVTTNDVIVSPQIAGQITQLLVNEGDPVKRDQLLAVIAPDELRADISYYSHNAAGMTSQVTEARAALRYQEQQTTDQIRQAEANLAAAQAQEAEAEANLEKARMDLERNEGLRHDDVVTAQQFEPKWGPPPR